LQQSIVPHLSTLQQSNIFSFIIDSMKTRMSAWESELNRGGQRDESDRETNENAKLPLPPLHYCIATLLVASQKAKAKPSRPELTWYTEVVITAVVQVGVGVVVVVDSTITTTVTIKTIGMDGTIDRTWL
jgi:hypothetical protein